MRNRRKLILYFACVAAAAALFALLIPSGEPRYQGRSLTAWLIQAQQTMYKPAEFEVARKAVRNIGTNALPYLLEWSQYPKPTFKSRVRALLAQARRYPFGGRWIPELFTRDMPFQHFMVAPIGFNILGPVGAPAAPELARKLRTAPDWWTARTCLIELQAIDPRGIPRLCEIITNPPPKGWTIAPDPATTLTGDMSPRVMAIQYLISMGTNAAPALPAFAHAVGDEETPVACHALLALGLTGAGQPITVPTLTNALRDPRPHIRAAAVDALSRLGAEARPALPALIEALRDQDATVREWTTNALRDIAREVLTQAPAQ